MSDLENKGGMAALLNIDTNMADFATLSASGKKEHNRFWFSGTRCK